MLPREGVHAGQDTVKSVKRIKEVGVRKSLGAEKKELITQFIGETAATVMLALLLALGAVYIALPAFNSLAGKSIGFSVLLDWRLASAILAAFVFTVVLSGAYPSLILGSVKAVEVLKASRSGGTGGRSLLRKSLIVFQFCSRSP